MTNILEQIIHQAAEAAVDGKLTDEVRVGLYKLALTVAAAELHRIEQTQGGTVQPESLLLLQQIGLLCEENCDPRKLLGGMGLLDSEVEDAVDEEDSGTSEQAPS